MKRTLISQLPNHINETVTVKGWVQTIRDQKQVQFLILRDHTGAVQLVAERASNEELARLISDLTTESAVAATGRVVLNAAVKLGGLEIQLSDLSIISRSHSPLPIDPFSRNAPDLDKRLDWRFLDLRVPRNLLIFRVQTAIEMAMREYWLSHGFIEIHSPKLMGTASESGAELFRVEYFGRTAYLAQSPQFYKQMAMAAGFDRVFEIGPVFRANPSFTSRHDTEFTSVDVEISWIESHEDVMEFEEQWLHYVFQRINEQWASEIRSEFGVQLQVPELPFPRITLAEAFRILGEFGHLRTDSIDLDPQGERLLCQYVKERYGHDFVFVTDYPFEVRPFYHMRHDVAPYLTRSFDLLWRGLEITTGAQREHRYDVLVRQAREKGLDTKPIEFYLQFFRYGCPPHGGFGFGLTRMLMILLGIKNVREVTYLYRGPNRLHP